jgi:hypothetical protein
MREFDLFHSDKTGEPFNTVYNNRKTINDIEGLKTAVTFDNVAAFYCENTRKNGNFIKSNCIMFDIDNTDSDTAADWITYDKLRADFSDVEYYTVTSRNHMKVKDGKAPRPKFHVYFPVDMIENISEYKTLKDVIKSVYTYFDKYAADSARFFFGNPTAEIIYFEGSETIAEYINKHKAVLPLETKDPKPPPKKEKSKPKEKVAPPVITATPAPPQTDSKNKIMAGERNSKMSAFAFTMLKKYGDGEKSRGEYVKESEKCQPPLSPTELKYIWDKAIAAYLTKIVGNSNYTPPKEYAQWKELQSIDIITPPPFPFSAFPKTLKEFTQSLSEYTQTAPEMACVLILGALGAVFQKKYCVVSINKNIEQLSIYAVAISPPAERKSEVIKHIISPFHKYQNAYNSEHGGKYSENEVKREDLKAAIIRAKGELDGTDEKREKLLEIQQEYDNFKELHKLTVIADDTTSEALISLMVQNNERMFIASGEGGVFSNMKGRYRQGGDDIEIYLKGHSGDYISVHRKSRESEILNAPAISMAICVQPYIIENILLDDENTGKGLTGRIVFAYPTARAGSRKAISDTPPVNKDYDKCIFYALRKTETILETQQIKLSDTAHKYAEEYFYIPEKRIEDGLERAMSWNGKAFGLSMRIAGLFHAFQCLEDEKDPAEIPIPLETMENAAKVTECLAVHAEKVFAGNDQLNNDGIYLLNKFKKYLKSGRREIPKQKVWQSVKNRIGNAANLDEVLQFLEERGYIKVEKQSTGGRPAEVVKINPFIIDGEMH